MAIYKGTSVVSIASGSIGPVTFRAGKAGQVVAAKRRYIRPQEDQHIEWKRCQAAAKKYWRLAGPNGQIPWNTLSNSAYKPDRLGTMRRASAYNLYRTYYWQQWLLTTVFFPMPPRYGSLPGPTTISATYSLATGLEVTTTGSWTVDHRAQYMYGQRGLRQTQTKVKNSWKCFSAEKKWADTQDMTAWFDGVFGKPYLGEVIGLKFWWAQEDYWASLPDYLLITVTA